MLDILSDHDLFDFLRFHEYSRIVALIPLDPSKYSLPIVYCDIEVILDAMIHF